jgi:surfactin synthase thioesterase subunit
MTDVHAIVDRIAQSMDVAGYLRPNAVPLVLFGHSMVRACLPRMLHC